jgi:DNA-binding PadR family transcriptional regulator
MFPNFKQFNAAGVINNTHQKDTMDKIRKFELMEKIVHELEDLKNSQQAIIQKLAKIEVDNIDLGDKRLEKDLPDMHQRVADNLDNIASILAYFANQTTDYSNQNNISALKQQEEINKL